MFSPENTEVMIGTRQNFRQATWKRNIFHGWSYIQIPLHDKVYFVSGDKTRPIAVNWLWAYWLACIYADLLFTIRRSDWSIAISLQWRHKDHDSVSNHQPHGCLLNRLFRRRSNKASKLRVTGLCVGNSPDRWIPRTKDQLRGKFFHLMTSSCEVVMIGSKQFSTHPATTKQLMISLLNDWTVAFTPFSVT